ncbi:SDR family oxidoreductase [Gordonibacter sp. Marseille-P4307]|uniref:SDR family NAD(P)-dependent oxidoreductase n=1 Tax=Gordonibacter sp. Marseille-P4307 TaxID=2161815 RepID=UPI000F52D349|nr:SDR family oxidoreductase [Gordonibacter sp. Marseille-P4307]
MQRAAIITGASGGLGAAFARIFAREGYNLLLVARSELGLREKAAELAETYGIEARWIALDLAQPDAPQRLLAFTRAQKIEVEALVNNAGIGDISPFADASREKTLHMVDLNVRCLTELCRGVLPDMLKRGSGAILNVASVAAFMPGPLMASYFATKAYVLSLSEALFAELSGTGVSCTALCPGPIRTGFWKVAGAEASPLLDALPCKTPAHIAEEGFRGLSRGKAIVVPGLTNKIVAFGVRFLPRAVVRRLAFRTMGTQKA